jgi:NAD(P)-dependent dehydrogenase (short-subunit alcohol dehydrogenase family)
MSNTSDNLANSSRRKLLGGMIITGALVAATSTAANTLRPAALTGPAKRDGRFRGKAVVVTGATSGIGATTAAAFAREGARVMFCGRREVLGRDVQASIWDNGGDAIYRRTDVREAAQVDALIGAAVAQFGRLDILFNNAGIFMTPGEVQDIAVENFLDILATNAGGVFYGMKYAIPQMRRQGGGVIINMASVAGHKGFPNTAAYNASKHAIIGLTKAAATANGKHNIRINSLSPLAVDTPQLRESFAYQKVDAAAISASFVTPRIMTTDEIASAVMFLASDQATSINGIDLDVTGGQLA